jgi:hypothetical protein
VANGADDDGVEVDTAEASCWDDTIDTLPPPTPPITLATEGSARGTGVGVGPGAEAAKCGGGGGASIDPSEGGRPDDDVEVDAGRVRSKEEGTMLLVEVFMMVVMARRGHEAGAWKTPLCDWEDRSAGRATGMEMEVALGVVLLDMKTSGTEEALSGAHSDMECADLGKVISMDWSV